MRYDIEGLRGVAIALVVIFHVFVGRVSAGVDVFLLLGGIFFFSSQLANARNPKGLTLVQSLIRMLRRLFPLLAVVVASTLAASLLLMNRLVHQTMASDAAASLGYVINWKLAFSGREYTAIRTTVSPFQHLWSMSAQLQIYVASLLVITLLALIFRRVARPAVIVVVSAATVASFCYAIYLNAVDQDLNYYSSLSRFWEIGLGGLVGLVVLRRDKGTAQMGHIPAWLRRVMGVVGLAMIVMTGWVVNGAQTFPGPLTLLPLGGALLVVIAGSSGTPVGLTRLLETSPFQFFGRISYALYLWHWPLLVLVMNHFDAPTVTPAIGLSVIGASVVLAWLSHKLVETPLRQKGKPARSRVLTKPSYWKRSFAARPKAIYGSVIILVALSVVASPIYIERRIAMGNEELWALAEERGLYPGAEAFLDGDKVPADIPLIPPLDDFERLLPPTQQDQCFTGFEGTFVATKKEFNKSQEDCAYGDPNGKTLYVIGGSHSEHYLPALDIIGKRKGIRFDPVLKMGCPINANVTLWNGEDYPDCREWSKKAMQYIKSNPPELGIFMTGTRPTTIAGNGPEIVPKEYVKTVQKFTDWGIHSYLIRDNPWHMLPAGNDWLNMRTCVAEMMDGKFPGIGPTHRGKGFPGLATPGTPTPEEVEEINAVCGTPAGESLRPVDPSIAAYEGLDATLLDVTAGVCEDGWCPGIIGNMVAYRDAHHYTNVFAETLAPEIEAQMFDPTYEIPKTVVR